MSTANRPQNQAGTPQGPAAAMAAVAEAQLRAINHRFVNAFVVPDPAFMDALTAPDFLLTSVTGQWIDRPQHLDLMRKPLPTAGVSYDDVRVRLFGDMALVHGVLEASSPQGAITRVRYTDVYQWEGSCWRLVGAQNTALREGVSPHQTRGTAPVSPPWQGEDPCGDDDSVLVTLNANYVRAFREADVAWYEAHLAPDWVVINSDGSFDDRAGGLQDFARPTFATHMRAFPVDKVRVRVFGNLALIHAENDYEMKDGRRGISRYTDIWQRQDDGRWWCVAAHITPLKLPA